MPHIAGHRDGDSTDCPGDALYHQLSAIRRGVRRLAPSPTRATLVLGAATPTGPAPAPVTPSQTAAEGAWKLSGGLALLDGTAIAGAPIKLQVRSVADRGEAVRERTVAETRTDAAGGWSLPLGAAGRAGGELWLRALYEGAGGQPAGAGAAVSDPLRVPAWIIASLPAPAPSEAASSPPAP